MSTTPKAIIYQCDGAGLANRLRALVGYDALSRIRQVPFYLDWKSNDQCAAAFDELFEPGSFELINLEQLDEMVALGAVVYSESKWFHAIWKQHAMDIVDWPSFVAEVKISLSRLCPRKNIEVVVDEFASLHSLHECTGIHLRHTDNIAAYKYWGKNSPQFNPEKISQVRGFADEMSRHPRSMRFFFATDNPKVEAAFATTFGDQLLTFPKQYRNADAASFRTSSIEAALIELLLLSKCSKIIGTYYSSFSKFSAAWNTTDYFEIRGRSCTALSVFREPG